jgi:transposase
MRGRKTAQSNFICLLNVEDRIPQKHPIRKVKELLGRVFERLDPEFNDLYAEVGRPSIPPERLLGSKVLMALYTVRSDTLFCERLKYDLLFQWFLDLNPDEASFSPTVFSKNQERLLQHHVSDMFFASVVELAREHGWISDEHFSADGTLIEAWASMKSFRPKGEEQGPGGGNAWMDFHGERRSNQTHQSTTDPEAKLLKKARGKEARLCFGGHAVMENRHGLCVHFTGHVSVGKTEPEMALEQVDELLDRGFNVKTIGADKNYHTEAFVTGCMERGIKPHVTLFEGRSTAGLEEATAKTESYLKSQVIRRRIEELFGWMKTTGGIRKSRYRGVERTHMALQLVAAASNLLRMAKLAMAPPKPMEVGA